MHDSVYPLQVILERYLSPGIFTCVIVLSEIAAISTDKDLKTITHQAKQARKVIYGLYLEMICNS